jgi:hypothetical protein
LGKSDFQTSPFDKLRAGSSGLNVRGFGFSRRL